MSGRLIGVVGPSGAGKDSVINGIAAAWPEVRVARRVITRAPDAGGEDYEPVSEPQFQQRAERGDFCLSWGAHGLFYGIPKSVLGDVSAGKDVLVNLSRGILADARQTIPSLIVLNVTARPETLAQRLTARGRETPQDIARRLGRTAKDFPDGLRVYDLANDGPIDETVRKALSILRKAEV